MDLTVYDCLIINLFGKHNIMLISQITQRQHYIYIYIYILYIGWKTESECFKDALL